MPFATMIAKIIFVLTAGLRVTGFHEGVGAFYHQVDLRAVCERRVAEGWNPGLDCEWPCLAASINAEEMGSYVLADLPGHSLVV